MKIPNRTDLDRVLAALERLAEFTENNEQKVKIGLFSKKPTEISG